MLFEVPRLAAMCSRVAHFDLQRVYVLRLCALCIAVIQAHRRVMISTILAYIDL